MEKESDRLKHLLDKCPDPWKLDLPGIEELMRSPNRDELLEDHPILHVLIRAIYNRESERETFESWLKILLNSDDVNIHSQDKNGLNPLSLAGELAEKRICEMLLGCRRIDVHNLNKNNLTAFEHVLDCGVTDLETWQMLRDRTKMTENLQRRIEKSFLNAVRELDNRRVEVLFELNLIQRDSPPKLTQHLRKNTIDQSFENGLWIRTLKPSYEDYVYENSRLDFRQNFSDQNLEEMGHQDSSQQNSKNYSPATFVFKGIEVPLFESGRPGVIIRTKNRILPYFYCGDDEKVTNEGGDLDYSKKILDNGAKSGQYHYISEGELPKTLEEQPLTRYQRPGFHCEIFNQKEYQIAPMFRWNEGLFRYKRDDVIGIYVPHYKLQLEKNMKAAYQLKACLNLPDDTPMLYYHKGEMWNVDDFEK